MLNPKAHISNSAQTVPVDLLPREKSEIAPWHFERCLNWMERLYLDRGLKIVGGDNQALYSSVGISKAQYFKRKKIIGASDSENKIEGEKV